MILIDLKKLSLPDGPGVYYFKKKRKFSGGSNFETNFQGQTFSEASDILYIGKATSLRDRVKSYFSKDLIDTRGRLLLDMVTKAENIFWQETDSVLEALILEANEIKKYQPYYNTKEKDDKSFNYVCITKEVIPKVLIVRGKNLDKKLFGVSDVSSKRRPTFSRVFGPYTSGSQLRLALKIIRRIFPFIDASSVKKQNSEFYRQLGLTPNLETSNVYKNNIRNIKLIFSGKKKKIVLALKKEMMIFAKTRDFERASEIKKQIFALEHINDVSLIKNDNENFSSKSSREFRIEAYDISHTSGQSMVGVMSVVVDGEKEPSEYRKFIIRGFSKSNDTGALREIIRRRFTHREWQFPDLIVADGGDVQKRVVESVLKESNIVIPVAALVKDVRHKPKALIGDKNIILKYKKAITLANAESHRFAVSFHRTKRAKKMFD